MGANTSLPNSKFNACMVQNNMNPILCFMLSNSPFQILWQFQYLWIHTQGTAWDVWAGRVTAGQMERKGHLSDCQGEKRAFPLLWG